MRALPLFLVAIVLAPAAWAAAPGTSPGEAVRALDAALVAGDVGRAREVYGASFHDAFGAHDPQLDARILTQLSNESASTRRAPIEMALAHGAFNLIRDNDSADWFDVLGFTLHLAAANGPDAQAAVARAGFARAVAAHMDSALAAWNDTPLARASADAASEAFAPISPALASVVGAPYATQAQHEVDSFVDAVASGDREEAATSSEIAKSILAEYLAPPTTTGERLAKFLGSADLLVSEYDAYVHNGTVVDKDAYETEVLGVFVPAMEQRWSAVEGLVVAAFPAQEHAINTAVDALKSKAAAHAPNEELRDLLRTIHEEVGKIDPEVSLPPATGDFLADANVFHDAVGRAIDTYAAGDRKAALDALASAYLDVYAPRLEPRILAAGSDYNARVERILNVEMRDAMQQGASVESLREMNRAMGATIEQARVAGTNASDGKLFFDSFLIMLREGFEAILVLGALATYLIRTGHKNKTPLIYAGAAAAVVATLILYLVVRFLVDSLPVSRDVLEAVTALLAVVVLFYVSYWLISKIEVGKWNRFIQGRMKGALAAGNSYALVGVAFLAVFREGFETVLFYQGLYTGGGHGAAISSGVLVGAVVLAALFVGFYRFGVKIPMRPFFIVTSILLYYLALAFAGKGFHELQDAGLISTTLIAPLASVLEGSFAGSIAAFFGIFPTWETLLAQGVLVLAIAGGLAWTFILEPRRAAIESVES